MTSKGDRKNCLKAKVVLSKPRKLWGRWQQPCDWPMASYCDANLRYLYTGEQKPRGAKRKDAGKVSKLTSCSNRRQVKTCGYPVQVRRGKGNKGF